MRSPLLLLAVEAAIWLLSVAGCIVAVLFSCLSPGRRFRVSVVLATAAVAAGYAGLGLRTPGSFLPQIGYTWSNGDFELSVQFRWFFVVPLLLGIVALVLAFWSRRRSRQAGTTAQ